MQLVEGQEYLLLKSINGVPAYTVVIFNNMCKDNKWAICNTLDEPSMQDAIVVLPSELAPKPDPNAKRIIAHWMGDNIECKIATLEDVEKLARAYDVMIIERKGQIFYYVDDKNRMFRQR